MKKIENKKIIAADQKKITLFRCFPKELLEQGQLLEYEPAEVIIAQGQPVPYLCFLTEGRCRIQGNLANGNVIILDTNNAPCILGEMEFLDEQDSAFSVIAINECRLFAFPMELSRAMLNDNAVFLHELCLTIRRKENSKAVRIVETYGYTFEHRLASFLLENANGNTVLIPKTIIAQSLGISYRQLNNVLNDLEQKGLIQKKRRSIMITAPELLHKLSEG